ncbi:TPA: hypothetical protein R1870_001905 [Klebsiella oxytoca]|nr:hypothetical protein [Klebsiella oxytoca]
MDEKPPSERTELPQNIEELRRYSRQQGQEITDRLRKEPAKAQIRHLCTPHHHPPKLREDELNDKITEEAFASIGDQMRTCRIFVSDKVVRSIARGSRIRHGGKVYAISNGILRQTTVDDAGNKDRPTTEYMAAYELVMRRMKATRQKSKTEARCKK